MGLHRSYQRGVLWGVRPSDAVYHGGPVVRVIDRASMALSQALGSALRSFAIWPRFTGDRFRRRYVRWEERMPDSRYRVRKWFNREDKRNQSRAIAAWGLVVRDTSSPCPMKCLSHCYRERRTLSFCITKPNGKSVTAATALQRSM